MERERELDSPVEEVWDAIVDDERLGEWFGADELALDVEPGGIGRFVFGDELRFARVDEVEEHTRLGLTWWPAAGDGAASRVTIELSPAPGRGTRIRVVETRLSVARPLAMAA
ncbi:MAG TPA: SRPBCC family protein [Acidimicrobiales bacterium]|nr:SRPBCC family protein [Acidimicrobiales bacterium]